MCRKKINQILAAILGFVALGGLLGLSINHMINKPEPYTKEIIYDDTTKVLTKDTIVDKIQSIAEITTLNIYCSKTANINKEEMLGSKSKDIIFKTESKFIFDLDKLDPSNIVVKDDVVMIFISEPKINSKILVESTEYMETKSKWISWGDIKMTAEYFDFVQAEVLKQVNVDVNSGANMEKAKAKLTDTLQNTLLKITNYNKKVEVYYVK